MFLKAGFDFAPDWCINNMHACLLSLVRKRQTCINLVNSAKVTIILIQVKKTTIKTAH